jgi:hypothetical protein
MAKNLPIELNEFETSTSLMFYTTQGLIWGDFVHHKEVLPGRVLVGASTPDILTLYNAQVMFTEANYLSKPVKHKEIFIHADNVLAYHITPPKEDKIDYDPTEPHRMMTAIKVHIGPFLAKAQMRISDRTTVKTNLEVSKSEFITFYDAEITHPQNPKMPPIKNNLVYTRLKRAIFAGV